MRQKHYFEHRRLVALVVGMDFRSHVVAVAVSLVEEVTVVGEQSKRVVELGDVVEENWRARDARIQVAASLN